MGLILRAGNVTNPAGAGLESVEVDVCNALGALASIFADSEGQSPISGSRLNTDAAGNYGYWAAPGEYTERLSEPGFRARELAVQLVEGLGAGGGGVGTAVSFVAGAGKGAANRALLQAAIDSGARKIIGYPGGPYELEPGAESAPDIAQHFDFAGCSFIRPVLPNYDAYRNAHLLKLQGAGSSVKGGDFDGNVVNVKSIEWSPNDCAIFVNANDCLVYGVTATRFESYGIRGRNCKGSAFLFNRALLNRVSGVFCYANQYSGELEGIIYLGNYIDMSNACTEGVDTVFGGGFGVAGLWIYGEPYTVEGKKVYPTRHNIMAFNRVVGRQRRADGSLLHDYPQCINHRGDEALIIGNHTLYGAQGFSEGGQRSIILGNHFYYPCGDLGWGVEVFDKALVAFNHIKGANVGCSILAPGQISEGPTHSGIFHNFIEASYCGVACSSPDITIESNQFVMVDPHPDTYQGSLNRKRVVSILQYDPAGPVYYDTSRLVLRGNRVKYAGTNWIGNCDLLSYRLANSALSNPSQQITVEDNDCYDVANLVAVIAEADLASDVTISNISASDNRMQGRALYWDRIVIDTGSHSPLKIKWGDGISVTGSIGPDMRRHRHLLDQRTNQWRLDSEPPSVNPEGNPDYVAGPGSVVVTKRGKLFIKSFGFGSRGWKVVKPQAIVGFDSDPDIIFELIDELPMEIAYARAGTATVDDWEGITRTAAPNEARFAGVTRVFNLLRHGKDLSVNGSSMGWAAFGGAVIVDAETATLPVSGGRVYAGGFYDETGGYAGAEGDEIIFSVELAAGDAGNVGRTVSLDITSYIGGGAYASPARVAVALTAEYQRYAVAFVGPAGAQYSGPQIYRAVSDNADRVKIRLAQGEDVAGQANPAPGFGVPTVNPPGTRAAYSRYRNGRSVDGATHVVGGGDGAENTTGLGLLIDSPGEVARISGSDFESLGLADAAMFAGMATIQHMGGPTDHCAVCLSDGTASNRVAVTMTSATNVRLTVVAAGAAAATLDATVTAGAVLKVAFAIGQDDFALCVNGGTVQRDTSGTAPIAALSQIDLGHYPDGTGTFGGMIRGLNLHFNSASPTDGDLQGITA